MQERQENAFASTIDRPKFERVVLVCSKCSRVIRVVAKKEIDIGTLTICRDPRNDPELFPFLQQANKEALKYPEAQTFAFMHNPECACQLIRRLARG